MGNAFETSAQTTDEEFSTPDAAVVAIAGTIEADAQHPLIPCAMLSQHGGEVSAMMLHRDFFRSGQAQRVCCRKVLRVRVVHDDQIIPAHVVHRNEIADGFLECLV